MTLEIFRKKCINLSRSLLKLSYLYIFILFSAAAVNRASTSNQPKPSSSNKPKSNQGKPQNTMLAYIGKDLAR